MTTLHWAANTGGLTIVTGRPGSGKSAATLAAADLVEDAGCAVVTVAEGTGVPPALSHGQAPTADLVVIDEVSDSERAAYAVRVALSGVPVLAVVCASDALEALDWFTELATRDDATERGVYTALTAVVRLGGTPDIFVNTAEATQALIDGRPSAAVRAAGAAPRTRAA